MRDPSNSNDHPLSATLNGPGQETLGEHHAETMGIGAGQQHFHLIFDHAADALFVCHGTDRRYLDVNEPCARMLGYAREELLSRTIDDVLQSDEHDRLVKALACLKVGSVERSEWQAKRKDGVIFRAEARVSKLPDGRIIGLFRNISQSSDLLRRLHKALEGRVAERTRQIESELERRILEERTLARSQRLETLGRLAGGLAHDFNNTLAAVKAFVELAHAKITHSQARTFLERALDAVDVGANINRRLLTFARREPATSVVSTADALLAISSIIERTLGSDISITIVAPQTLWHVRMDRSEFESAVLNLAINARDAMVKGGALTITAQNIPAETARAGSPPGDFVCVTVTDTGKGMPSNLLTGAESPFFTTKGERGTGLGLDSVREFVRKCGGFMSIESHEDQGTAVHLYLPRTDLASLHYEPRPSSSLGAPLGDGETILLVEDDSKVLEATHAILEGLAYTVVCARSAAEAIGVLEQGEPIAAVVSDVLMPGGLSGYDLADTIRARFPAVKIVLASGHNDLIGVSHAEPLLRKPYSRQLLAQTLHAVLSDQHADQDKRTTSPPNT